MTDSGAAHAPQNGAHSNEALLAAVVVVCSCVHCHFVSTPVYLITDKYPLSFDESPEVRNQQQLTRVTQVYLYIVRLYQEIQFN